jgi:hypothetical protein
MAIFNSYVKLPEGKPKHNPQVSILMGGIPMDSNHPQVW